MQLGTGAGGHSGCMLQNPGVLQYPLECEPVAGLLLQQLHIRRGFMSALWTGPSQRKRQHVSMRHLGSAHLGDEVLGTSRDLELAWEDKINLEDSPAARDGHS